MFFLLYWTAHKFFYQTPHAASTIKLQSFQTVPGISNYVGTTIEKWILSRITLILKSVQKSSIIQVSLVELSGNFPLQSREYEKDALIKVKKSFIPKLPGIILLAAFHKGTKNTAEGSIFCSISLNTTIYFDLRNEDSLLSYANKDVVEINRHCLSMDLFSGNWTTDNCKSILNKPNEIECQCYDSVAFATRYQITYMVRTTILEVMYVLCAVFSLMSIVFLVATLYLLIKHAFKHRRDLVTIQISTTLAILLLHVFTVVPFILIEIHVVDNMACYRTISHSHCCFKHTSTRSRYVHENLLGRRNRNRKRLVRPTFDTTGMFHLASFHPKCINPSYCWLLKWKLHETERNLYLF